MCKGCALQYIKNRNKINMKLLFLTLISFSFTLSYGQFTEMENIVGKNISLHSKLLDEERTIQIFLPESYDQSEKEYPVLYILDGQKYFLHGVGLQESFSDFRQTPEFIVVGISKTKSERNTNFSSNSDNFLNFIELELLEFIDANFRTSNKRLIFGWAYGGGFAFKIMIDSPKLFDAYIIASPFPLGERISELSKQLSANPNISGFLYFTSGANEGVVTEGTESLNSLLIEKAAKTLNWSFNELEEEHRSTPYTTLYHGVKKYFHFFSELQFSNLDQFNKSGGLNYVYHYYEQRASQFGFSPELSDWTMFSLTRNAIREKNYAQFDIFMKQFSKSEFINRLKVNRACLIAEFYLTNESYEEAKDIFKFLVNKFPLDTRPLNGLANTYEALKDDKNASECFEKIKKIKNN